MTFQGGDGWKFKDSCERRAHIGAMEDVSGKVQKAYTHILRRQNHEHAHSSQSVQWGDGTLHAQRRSCVRSGAKLTEPCHDTRPAVSIPLGRWMKIQGKGRRQAYEFSRVVMDIAAFKVCHPVGGDRDATALQAKKWSA